MCLPIRMAVMLSRHHKHTAAVARVTTHEISQRAEIIDTSEAEQHARCQSGEGQNHQAARGRGHDSHPSLSRTATAV